MAIENTISSEVLDLRSSIGKYVFDCRPYGVSLYNCYFFYNLCLVYTVHVWHAQLGVIA